MLVDGMLTRGIEKLNAEGPHYKRTVSAFFMAELKIYADESGAYDSQ